MHIISHLSRILKDALIQGSSASVGTFSKKNNSQMRGFSGKLKARQLVNAEWIVIKLVRTCMYRLSTCNIVSWLTHHVVREHSCTTSPWKGAPRVTCATYKKIRCILLHWKIIWQGHRFAAYHPQVHPRTSALCMKDGSPTLQGPTYSCLTAVDRVLKSASCMATHTKMWASLTISYKIIGLLLLSLSFKSALHGHLWDVRPHICNCRSCIFSDAA